MISIKVCPKWSCKSTDIYSHISYTDQGNEQINKCNTCGFQWTSSVDELKGGF